MGSTLDLVGGREGGRRARGGVGGGEGRGGGRDWGALGFAGEECRLWPVGCWARWGEKVRRERCRWIRVDQTKLDP